MLVEGGQEEGRRLPPTVPRTQRRTSLASERSGPGVRRERGRTILLNESIKKGRRGGARVDEAEGASGGDHFDQIRAVTDGPLGPKGTDQGESKGMGLAGAIEV